MATGSNPVSGATFPQSPNTAFIYKDKAKNPSNYDTFCKNYDTTPLRLYKVNNTFYYRRRYAKKLIRISLRTKNIKEALNRKKVLDLLKGSELFKLEMGDFKLMFEYDTEEELKVALENVMQMQMNTQLAKFRDAKQRVLKSESKMSDDSITFEQLRISFVKAQKREGKTTDSIKEYDPTFKKLIDFFKERNIYELVSEDLEEFKEYLNTTKVRSKNLSKKTINKNLTYVKMFLKHIKLKDLAEDIKLYSGKIVRKEQPLKENYTNEEIKKILTYDYKEKVIEIIIKIALYTGMRQGEIRTLDPEDILKDEKAEIYYFDIPEAKSEAGVRKIPIHNDILNLVLDTKFPLIPELQNNKNAFSKKVRLQLYKAVDEKGKNFHTLRANFIDNIVENNIDNNHPFTLNIIQEIVGHMSDNRHKLTLKTYKKGFNLKDKKELMDKVIYQLD